MRKRFKNIFKVIKSAYAYFLSLIYEEGLPKLAVTKLDSRTIAPPRSGTREEKMVCGAVSNGAILSYSNRYIHSAIYWFKYKRDKYIIKFLSRILLDEILEIISNNLDARHNIKEWIITFAPSTSFHCGDKKWDHNEDIFKEMKKNSTFTFQKIFGFGNNEIRSSKKLSKLERQVNKFSLLPNIKIPEGSGLIIFDDVTTTGSTLKNLEGLAEKLNPKIILAVAIAH